MVYTDASVRAGFTGVAVVADGFKIGGRSAWSDRFAGDNVFAGELRAVLFALTIVPRVPLVVVCDNVDVRKGAGFEPGSRPSGFGGPVAGPLWAEFDRLTASRRVTLVAPSRKNRGLHGHAHRLSRAAAKPLELTDRVCEEP